VAKPSRLDAELVRRGLTTSRTEARRAIESGLVMVAGVPATKPASLVAPEVSIALSGPSKRFASRGGEKLDHALESLDVQVSGKRWLDAGASTGGFTDRLLEGGAQAVVSVDVGYGQLDWLLRNDPRVTVMERTNVRNLSTTDLPWEPDGVVADLSFISLVTVLPALCEVARANADFVLLVKPQFEAGRKAVSKGGVVKDPDVWTDAIRKVIAAGEELGLGLAGAVLAEPPGPSGNREFFIHLREGGSAPSSIVDAAVDEARS